MARVASAKRHAQAVFQIALDTNEVERWRSELNTVAATLSDRQLSAILEDPRIHFDDKVQLINKCLPDISQLALNFAYLIVMRRRLSILESTVAEYERMADAQQGLEHAAATTAIPLDEKGKERLARRLADVIGKQIVLAADVDPAIVGGFVIRIGDKLIDGSTKAKLEALKKSLVRAA